MPKLPESFTYEDLARRVEELKTDPFIKDCLLTINKILINATPRLTIGPVITPPDSIVGRYQTTATFDIDEMSKALIAKWKQRIDDYVADAYSDLNIKTEGYIP